MQTLGVYTTTTEFQVEHSGFLSFTAKVTGKGSARLDHISPQILLGGISYIDIVPDIQIDFCVPVRKGDNLRFFISGSGSIVNAALYEAISAL